MPTEDLKSFEESNFLVEVRGIRCGESGDRYPNRTKPKVRMPIKNAGSKKFDLDKEVMTRAAERLNLVNGKGELNVDEVPAIPVYLLSDNVLGDDAVIYLERALYGGRGRLCSSAAGESSANQLIDIGAYGRNKSIKILPAPKSVDCTSSCPLWGKRGQKTDCGWRAIVTMQLQDMPVFPSTVRHRTKSFYSIISMISSLRAIASETGGVLTGIPLWFRQHTIDVRDSGGEKRRIQIMSFEFEGTKQGLREQAVREILSRKQVEEALKGLYVSLPPAPERVIFSSSSPRALPPGASDEIIDVASDDEDDDFDGPSLADLDDEVEPAPAPEKNALAEEIAMSASRLGYTRQRMKLLEDKHDGELEKILAELKAQSGAVKTKEPDPPAVEEWSSGEVGEEKSETEAVVADVFDEVFGDDDF